MVRRCRTWYVYFMESSQRRITLQTIWSGFKDFCKPQSNAVCARFDLLTAFQQGNRSIDEWYNTVLAHILLHEYLRKQLQSSLGTFSGSSWQIMSLLPKPLMKATPTLHNTQLHKCDRWPKSFNPAKPLPNTSNSTHPACRVLLKSMYYDITRLAYHPRRKKAVKNQTPAQEPNCSNLSSTNR